MPIYPADIALLVALGGLVAHRALAATQAGAERSVGGGASKEREGSGRPILFLCCVAAFPLVSGGTVYLVPAQDASRSVVEPGRSPGIPLHRTKVGVGLFIFAASFASDAMRNLRRATRLERAAANEHVERYSRDRWG